MPLDPVCARRERRQSQGHLLWVGGVNNRSAGRDWDAIIGGKLYIRLRRIERLSEEDADFRRRRCDRATDRGNGMVGLRVCDRDPCGKNRGKSCQSYTSGHHRCFSSLLDFEPGLVVAGRFRFSPNTASSSLGKHIIIISLPACAAPSRRLPWHEAAMWPHRPFLFSSPGIRVILSGRGISGRGFALAFQLHQTSADGGKIVDSANRHRFLLPQ
jgi:hypothetical protein